MARPKKSVQETVQKLYPEFTPTVDGLSVADLETKLATYAKEAEKVEDAKENDIDLNSAKEQVTELTGPYRDAKKAIRLKSRYIIALIREKGGE